MDLKLSDLKQYYGENQDILLLVHGTLAVLVIGLVIDLIVNLRRERRNKIQLQFRPGTYMEYVWRDMKFLFVLFILYILAVPFLFGFIKF
jgi:hypothetical protein